jgi:hypothetical protein
MPAQTNSSSREPNVTPTLVDFNVNGVTLQFWVHKDYERGLIQVMVKKKSDLRPYNESERYVIFTITSHGECYRNSGLPDGWGFRLTKERRIKEVRM